MAEDFQFIRLLFPVPAQEEAAVRLLRALAIPLVHHVGLLRPETKVEEMISWAEAEGADTVEFIMALEGGIGMEVDLLSESFERMPYREVVEHVCERDI
jgi:hypothetical protein